jgi:hypothetical protein
MDCERQEWTWQWQSYRCSRPRFLVLVSQWYQRLIAIAKLGGFYHCHIYITDFANILITMATNASFF